MLGGKNEVFIHDGNWQDHVVGVVGGVEMGRGLVARDHDDEPLGGFAAPFDLPVIPRSQWPALIAEQERTQSSLWHIRERGLNGQRIPSLNQGQTNYCWSHGPVSAMTLIRAFMGQPYVRLSATAVAAIIKGGRNQGGWGTEALRWIAAHGCPPVDLWPPNDRSLRHDTPAMRTEAGKNKITEWYDLRPRNFDQLATCLLLNIPVAVGYNWWSHEVCAIRLRQAGGAYVVDIWNSWGDSYGTDGIGTLSESRATPDDAVAPRVVMGNG